MDYSNEVLKIVEGALKSDKAKVSSYTRLLIDKLKENNEVRLAGSFTKILNNAMSSMTQKSITDIVKVPLDQESRLPMADTIYPDQVSDIKIVLNKSASDQVEKFLEYYKNSNSLTNAGIKVPNAALLYGPPGCGKSKLASYICSQINLPLVTARIDGLISSYLGSTAKNIRTMFEYAQAVPCILFLDEFDALAKVRDDNNELGELKRVVNSLLQNIDGLQNGSIIIAATNHEQLLDPAVWRRFAFRVFVDKPDMGSRIKLISCFLEDFVFSKKDISLIAMAFDGLTGAEIEEICNKSLIDSLIAKSELNIHMIFENYFELKKINDKSVDELTKKTLDTEKAKHLRCINSKTFSCSNIGYILNVSKSYVHSILKIEEVSLNE